jgi:hypothetical protein
MFLLLMAEQKSFGACFARKYKTSKNILAGFKHFSVFSPSDGKE